MTIPAREDEAGIARPAETGPVFSVDPGDGTLHMRYTARTKSIEWKRDPAVAAAVAALSRILGEASPFRHRLTLEAGMGIVCNNVLHERTGFVQQFASLGILHFDARLNHELIGFLDDARDQLIVQQR